MEVLQTSALPLGDGAGRNCWIVLRECRPRLGAATTATCGAGDGHPNYRQPIALRRTTVRPRLPHQRAERSGRSGRHVAERAERGEGPPRRNKLERETGFEPATSTLARSHSTTELFPLATNIDHIVANSPNSEGYGVCYRPSRRGAPAAASSGDVGFR